MHLIAVIGFTAFGVLALSVAVWHEFTWWKKRGWIRGRGIVVGYSDSSHDGESYFPEIEFQGRDEPVRFISDYGSGKKPTMGESIDILIDESGNLAEEISPSNRLVFTIIPLLFGLVFISVGVSIQPIESADQAGADQSATAPESKSEGKEKPKLESERRSQ